MARQGSWGLLVAIATGVMWTVGIILLCLLDRATRPTGLLLVIIAAMTTALLVFRSWMLRVRAAYVHGFHAGFHDQAMSECAYPMDDCQVLELAQLRASRISTG